MKQEIQKVIFDTVKSLGWDVALDDILIEYPPSSDMGDYTTNVAFGLAKKLKKSPHEIAERLAEAVADDRIDRAAAAGAGYVNIYLKTETLQNTVREIVKKGEEWGDSHVGKGKKVLLEFISSNPTGPIHLGNARGGPLGDTLASVLEKVGYEVEREFYVNDYGNQVEILGHSVLGDEEKQYSGEYIEKLALERSESLTDPRDVGMWAAGKILKEHIRPTCEKLGITFSQLISEKSLHNSGAVEEMLKFLQKKDLVFERGGALWYRSTKFGDDKDRVLKKSDGKATYRLADFAYHKDKLNRGFDRLITILGADHHSEALEMKRFIEDVLGKAGAYETILTQFVRVMKNGKEVKMSKRKGTYLALDDLLEEVGKDAVRFGFVSYASSSHINFDIDLALDRSEKNPVFYVQYAHARIASILRKAREEDMSLSTDAVKALTHPKERELIRKLMRFGDLIEEVSKSYEVHRLPQYGRELADVFHSFYDECRVIDGEKKELSSARLALALATKTVLAETLRMCGVSAPEKM